MRPEITPFWRRARPWRPRETFSPDMTTCWNSESSSAFTFSYNFSFFGNTTLFSSFMSEKKERLAQSRPTLDKDQRLESLSVKVEVHPSEAELG